MKSDESMTARLHEHGKDLIRYFLLWKYKNEEMINEIFIVERSRRRRQMRFKSVSSEANANIKKSNFM